MKCIIVSGMLFFAGANLAYSAEKDSSLQAEINWLQAERSSMVEVVSKQKEDKNTAAGIVSIVSHEDIERYGGNNLFDVLNRVTSFYMLGSPLWGRGNASVRGDLFTAINNHTLVLLDGRPFRDSSFGGVNETVFRDFPLHQIAQIEVVRGSGSVLYGSNAFAAVINVVTKKAKADTVTIRGRYGSFNTGQMETEFSGKAQDVAVTGAVRYRTSKGWQFSGVNYLSQPSSFRQDEEDVSANLSTQWHDFSLNAFFVNNKNTNWGPAQAINGNPQNDERLFIDLGYKKQFTPQWLSQWNFTYNQNTDSQMVPAPSATALVRVSENNLLLENTQFFNFFEKRLHVLVGGLVEWQTGRINQATVGAILPTYNHLKSSIYGEMTYSLLQDLPFVHQLKLTVGGQWNRFEHLEKSVLTTNTADKSTMGEVGRAGLVYEITPQLGIKLLYSQAFRSPSSMELEINAFLQGNRALKPERIETADAQLFYHDDKYQASLTAFRSRESNLIVIVPIPNAFGNQQANGGSVTFLGLELETQAQMTNALQWKGSYTFQTNRDEYQQNNATLAPNHIAKIGLSYDALPGLQLSLFDTFVSKAKVGSGAALVNPPIRNYHNVSFNANAKLDKLLGFQRDKPMTFTLYVDNLLNEKIYYPDFNLRQLNSISGQPGRTLFGELAIQF